MTSYSSQNQSEKARVKSGFFIEEPTAKGQFDFNADKYRSKQIELANRIEDMTGVTFWETKNKFSAYDYHLCKDNDPKQFLGSGTCVPGLPMYWQEVDSIAELKYRQIPSDYFTSTLLDADKLKEMKVHSRDMNMDSYIIWAFTDCDMYYKVDVNHNFKMMLGRNTQTSEELEKEFKPQVLIPMEYLKKVTPDMFGKE
tara:strand:+ start:3367 stop:3960 length:594 start_codon:yes stop_codon:yes gene_type:complete